MDNSQSTNQTAGLMTYLQLNTLQYVIKLQIYLTFPTNRYNCTLMHTSTPNSNFSYTCGTSGRILCNTIWGTV